MPYPNKHGRDAWNYRSVKNLLGGLNTSTQADTLTDEQSITLNNVLCRAGSLRSDTGYSTFGQVVSGQPQATFQFDKTDILTEELLITTATVYKWSTDFSRWILLKGTAGTTTTAGYAAGTTVIAVADATGFATGNLVGITLDNGDQLQTTITISGLNFTLADAVPAGRSVANGAAVIKSVALAGSLDKQISILTIPANNWAVFTNGTDVVKRYDGIDCIDVPNLPSGGDVVCKAIAYYNTALFLLNTIEGGVSYPQRARRSDQTDPANWTTGTSGFDNLLDFSDTIQLGEVLGPYLIIYRERSIVRGSFIGSSGVNYRFESAITAEGALSSGAVVNMGDYHIFVGHTNIYEYRGGYSIVSIGDNIFHRMFGYSGDKDPSYDARLFIFYVDELDEVWIAYVSTESVTKTCDKVLRYNVGDSYWYSRNFADELIGYGFFLSEVSLIWSALIGSWSAQSWTWNSRQSLANSPTTHLCSGETNQVFSYDYISTLDNVTPIAYNVETKDFTLPDGQIRFDMIEMMIQGTNILLEYSTDSGISWNTLATITQSIQDRIRLYKQLVAYKIRFRWTGSSPDFVLRWFGFSFKNESIY